VRQLHVLGVSDDGAVLLLGATARSSKPSHRVPLDDRLRAAVRGQLAVPGADRAQSALTPKEIQARLRAGATPDDVAKAAQVPVARVLPYFAPVEAERERIISEARRASVHRYRGPDTRQPLGEAVDARLREVVGLKDESVQWTARRRHDGAWIVGMSYAARGGVRTAEWLWQPAGRELSALDASASRLAADAAPSKKRPAKKQPAKKQPVRKPGAVKKAPVKKAAPKKAAPNTAAAPANRAAAKKVAAKKAVAPAKKMAVQKAAPTRRVAAKKAVPKKALAKKVPSKKALPTKAGVKSAPKRPAATRAARATFVARKAPAARTLTVVSSPDVVESALEPVAVVVETVVEPVAVPIAEPVVEIVAQPAAGAVRRSGRRVPLPSWSDVLLGVTSSSDPADRTPSTEPEPSTAARRGRS
jgi:hypothetical protein